MLAALYLPGSLSKNTDSYTSFEIYGLRLSWEEGGLRNTHFLNFLGTLMLENPVISATQILKESQECSSGAVIARHQVPLFKGFFQARILEWVDISYSRGSS